MAGAITFSKPVTSALAVGKHVNTLYTANQTVTIYNTGGLHGHFEAACKHLGGLHQTQVLLTQQDTFGLLLDGGNFLNSAQSAFRQKQTILAMNRMGYHAATVGVHELANGQEHLAALANSMQFNLVNCNYQFGPALAQVVKPYVILHSGPYKIGVTGVGKPLAGVGYADAITSASRMAGWLKQDKACDLVICLSHFDDNRKLARESEHLDMVISGADGKLLNGSLILHNKSADEVVLNQTGKHGLLVGKTSFTFNHRMQKQQLDTRCLIPGHLAGENYADAFTMIAHQAKQLNG